MSKLIAQSKHVRWPVLVSCMHKSIASCAQPVLMLDRADVAADINRLRGLKHRGVDMDGLLLDLGRVMELKRAIAAAKNGTSVPVRSYSAMNIADMAHLARRQLRLAIDAVGLAPPKAAAAPHSCTQAASQRPGATPVSVLLATAAQRKLRLMAVWARIWDMGTVLCWLG